MTRTKGRNRPAKVVERTESPEEMVARAVQLIERANAKLISGPRGQAAPLVPYSESLLQYILNNRAPQRPKTHDLSPGAPIQPYKGAIPLMGPRQYPYQIGSNTTGVDRSEGDSNIPDFSQLRSLAYLYSGIGMCERVILDMVPRLVPQIKLKPHMVAKGYKEADFQKEISQYLTFFEKPDRKHDMHSWLKIAYQESTQIDALAIYKAPNRAGGLYGLQIIDGTTVKPLKDERGMRPDPPFYAYQQYVYGIPGALLTSDQMLYHRETPRANSMYGRSRVERIIIEVNQALRKKRLDLARFTEGNMPQGIMQVPAGAGWTPDMIDAYEQAWNSLLAGNEQMQARVKFTQPGFVFTKLEPDDIMTPFDMLVLNICVGTYGLSMGDLGFTGDLHKSSDGGQQNMMFRRTLYPFTATFADMFTEILARDFGDDRFYFVFGGFEEYEDIKAQADAYVEMIQYGILSPATVARIMKYPDVPETGPFLYTKTGQPLFLTNYEVGSKGRKLFDEQFMQLSASAVQGVNPQETGLPDGKPPDTAPKPHQPQPAVTGAKHAQGAKNPPAPPAPPEKTPAKGAKAPTRRTFSPIEDERAYSAEMRLWRLRVLEDMKASRPVRDFTPQVIPPDHYAATHKLLRYAIASGMDESVRGLFRTVKEQGIAAIALPEEEEDA